MSLRRVNLKGHVIALRLFSLASALFSSGLVLLTAGCSRLPEFAAPKGGRVTSDPQVGDAITYRALERADFKRQGPPGQIKFGQYEIGALTCSQVRTAPDTSIEVQQRTGSNGEVIYEGRIKRLRFYALMDRDCSWWNPDSDDPEYTLQHEQIHFAISEIAARRLNREAERALQEWHETGKTQEEVVERLKERVTELLEEHNEAALERDHDFDEDTSVGRNPKRQNEWWEEINRELRETEAWK